MPIDPYCLLPFGHGWFRIKPHLQVCTLWKRNTSCEVNHPPLSRCLCSRSFTSFGGSGLLNPRPRRMLHPVKVTSKVWNFNWFTAFRNSNIIGVEPITFLYFFGVFLYFTLSQQYIFNRYGLELSFNTSELASARLNGSSCISVSELDYYSGLNNTYQLVQERSARISIYTSIANRLLSVVSTLFLGPLSDMYGRKPVFILVSLGSILQGICALFTLT